MGVHLMVTRALYPLPIDARPPSMEVSTGVQLGLINLGVRGRLPQPGGIVPHCLYQT